MLRHPVPWLRSHPEAADALLAAVLGTVSLVGLLTVDADSVGTSVRDADALGVALVIGIWTATAFRRRWPERVAVVVAALTVPFWVLGYVDLGTTIAMLLLIYTVAAHVDRPRSLRLGLALGLLLTAVMVAGVVADDEDLPAIAVVANAIVFATAWTIGDAVRSRHAYLREVEARAEAAERGREQAAQRAVHEERARVARELHDIVAHSISVMVVQASAARRVIDRDPARSAEALGVIEQTGRTALDELRGLLSVLRDGTPETVPQPTVDDLPDLVQHCRDAGLDVTLEVLGDRPELSAVVSLTVYRVVQEGLTNVMKHAGPARAEITLRYGAEVVVEVADDGRGPMAHHHPGASGQGLIGMRERVELFGGSLFIGARPGGGFRLRATIPVAAVVPA